MALMISLVMLTVTACGEKTIETKEKESVEEILEEPEVKEDEPENEIVEDITDIPQPVEDEPEEIAEWKNAYIGLLDDFMNGKYPKDLCVYGYMPGDEGYEELYGQLDEINMGFIPQYCLYDVNKDEVPELFIRTGNCEANYDGQAFTYVDDEIKYIGEFSLGHSALYTYPNGNGVVRWQAHMGYSYMQVYSLTDDYMFETEAIFEEDIADDPQKDYTPVSALVENSISLAENGSNNVLPILHYEEMTRISTENVVISIPDDEAVEFYKKVMSENMEVYGVSVDGYGGDTGKLPFSEYIKQADTYADNLEVARYTFCDINHDRYTECILQIASDGNLDKGTSIFVILSEQDGVVYAYSMHYIFGGTILEDGTILEAYEDYDTEKYYKRVYFDKNVAAFVYCTPTNANEIEYYY